jgi:predicted transcriptional regulator
MSIESIPISSFMTANVKSETADQTIHAACRIMHKNNIGSVIVVKDYTTEPLGIITERLNAPKGNIISAKLGKKNTHNLIDIQIQFLKYFWRYVY